MTTNYFNFFTTIYFFKFILHIYSLFIIFKLFLMNDSSSLSPPSSPIHNDTEDINYDGKSNFSVVIRVRPPLPRELAQPGYINVIQCVDEHTISISERQDDQFFNTHVFTFDQVYDENATQSDVYDNTARNAVLDTIKGYNATICAFGQTSSGKTYTTLGANGILPTDPVELQNDINRGIIPRATEEIFNYIQNKSSSSTKFLVRASYLQIYNDVISDLLKPERTQLKIRQDKKRGVFVENLSEWVVRSPAEIYSLLARGAQVRVEGSTRMNDKSSRSHAVFIIILEQSETTVVNENGEELNIDIDTFKRLPKSERKGDLKQVFKIGKLNLVDLAGSERQRFSGTTGVRFDESKQINKSLSALGHVIKKLTSGHPKSHVPYRDSKLTRLLQDSLGGNCKTTMVINISPGCFSESLSALKFANRAKSIKNKAQINEDLSERALIRKYERELKRLRTQLDNKNKEVGDKRRVLQLEEEKRCAEEEKLAALTALEKRSREFMAEKQAKRELEQKIVNMTSNMLVGGEKIEETPQFRNLLNKEFQRVHREYVNRLQEIERERQSIDEDKQQVDRYKQLLLKQRDIMIALTARLNERDETIISLQEELDVYDSHQQMLEQALQRKTGALIQVQQLVSPRKAQQAEQIVNFELSNNILNEIRGQTIEQRNYESARVAMEMETLQRNVQQLVHEKMEQKAEIDQLREKLATSTHSKENNATLYSLQEENNKLQSIIQKMMNNKVQSSFANETSSIDEEGTKVISKVAQSLEGNVQHLMDSLYKTVCELQDSSNMSKVVKAKSAIAELTRAMEKSTADLKLCIKQNPQGILKSSNINQIGNYQLQQQQYQHQNQRYISKPEKHVSFMSPRSQAAMQLSDGIF